MKNGEICGQCGEPLKYSITLYMPGYFCSLQCGRIYQLSKDKPEGSLILLDLMKREYE